MGAGASARAGADALAACQPGMEDLSATSGLPLWLNAQEHCLVLALPEAHLEAEPQPLQTMRRVLADPDAAGPDELYWVYRDVELPTDAGVFAENGVRHGLWLLRAGKVGAEYIKTWGHMPTCPDGLLCPEVYGVLHGRALFLLQQVIEAPESPATDLAVSDARWIQAHTGQKVVVPSGYGVVVANDGDVPLVLSSLVSADAWPVHLAYERMRGAAYYVTEREGQLAFAPNLHYAAPLPPLREDAPPQSPDLGISTQEPLYSAFVRQPERFAWLREGAPALAGVG
ncbi:MAG: glucose-6-phosphate isomerase family protein [Anaerolineae bacterium]